MFSGPVVAKVSQETLAEMIGASSSGCVLPLLGLNSWGRLR